MRAFESRDSTVAESVTRSTSIPVATTRGGPCGRTLAEGGTQHPDKDTAALAIRNAFAGRYGHHEKYTCFPKAGPTPLIRPILSQLG